MCLIKNVRVYDARVCRFSVGIDRSDYIIIDTGRRSPWIPPNNIISRCIIYARA